MNPEHNLQGAELVYLVCFFVGLFFAVISAAISGFMGGVDGGVDVSGGHGGAHSGGTDVGGHGHHGGIHLSAWNPMIIAVFLTFFGAAGYISKEYFHLGLPAQLAAGGGSGAAIGGLMFWLMLKFYQGAMASSEVRLHDVLGMEAEVTVAIPADGVGQVAFISGGRHTSPATSIDSEDIPQGSLVKIRKVDGPTFHVERIP